MVETGGQAKERLRISVAMPTYNGARFLREQLDSILKQLGDLDEVVISDDGSADETIQIIKEYQKTYGAIRLLKGPGKGVKKNVEWALRHCRGEYIFLADQDDIWMEDKVEQVMRLFREKQAGLVIHDAVVFDSDSGKTQMESFFAFRQSRAGVLKNQIKNSYIGCCMAFRRRILQEVIPIPNAIEMHDQWIGVLHDYFYGNSYFYKKPLIFYRRHGDNNSDMARHSVLRMIRNKTVFLFFFICRILRVRLS